MTDEMNIEDYRKRPVFRDTANIIPQRQWIRDNCEYPGMTVEDIDVLPWFHRVYGTKMQSDSVGRFMFVEIKHTSQPFHDIGVSKRQLFGEMDRLFKKGDPNGYRYQGYYLVCETSDNWDEATIHVNGIPISDGTEIGRKNHKAFCEMNLDLLSQIRDMGHCPLKNEYINGIVCPAVNPFL